MRSVLELLRPHQWYKNLLVFAAVFFSHNFLNIPYLKEAAIGFLILCCVSSAGYCVNDLLDAKADRVHAEKKQRPVASGRVPVWAALGIALLLYGFGLVAAYMMNMWFFVSVVSIAVLSLLYSVALKHVLFLDILVIATNFVLRALAGVFLISVPLSPWFLLVILFLAIYLVAAKRHGDALLLAKGSKLHKPVLEHYTQEVVFALLQVSMGALCVFYGLYAFFTDKPLLFLLFPVFLFMLLRYYFLTLSGHPLIRRPERFFTQGDWQLGIASALFAAGLVVLYYA